MQAMISSDSHVQECTSYHSHSLKRALQCHLQQSAEDNLVVLQGWSRRQGYIFSLWMRITECQILDN